MIIRFVFLLLSCYVFSQEPVTFSNDRFSGISAVGFSPTQPFLNENPWDINLFAADLFVQNDYGYISRQSVLGLLKADIKEASIRNGISGTDQANVQDYFNKNRAGFHVSSDILGPSVSFETKIGDKKYRFGFFTKARAQGSAVNVDNYLKFNNKGINPPGEYYLQPFKSNFMNWGEVGINAATIVFPNSQYRWILGVNLKYELGFDAANIDSKDILKLISIKRDGSSDEESVKTLMTGYNIESSYATSYDFENRRYNFSPNGKGLGFDIGLAFINQESDEDAYDFKMAFNILDIGFVKYDGEVHLLNGKTFDFDTFDDMEAENPHHFFQLISEQMYDDPNASYAGSSFKIGLPTSIHFNLSKRIAENQFINFDFVQRTPVFENSLKRDNIAHVSYSVQKRVMGYGASASLYEYKNMQFGGYVRVGPLILGSENVFPFLFKQKTLHSADFYIALKIYPFWDDDLDRRQRSDCYCD